MFITKVNAVIRSPFNLPDLSFWIKSLRQTTCCNEQLKLKRETAKHKQIGILQLTRSVLVW